MKYPTLEEVEAASHEDLCRWWRFLPSPGTSAIGTDNYMTVLESEAPVITRVVERFRKLGGFTPAMSKRIGWEVPS